MNNERNFLGRLLRTNDELIKLVMWTIDNDKLDCAGQLAPVTTAFASILAEMGTMQLPVHTRRVKIKLLKKRRK